MSQNNVGRMALESLRRKGFQWSLDSLSMGLELTSGNPAKGHTLNISEDSVNIRRFGELMSNHFHNRARKIIGSSPFFTSTCQRPRLLKTGFWTTTVASKKQLFLLRTTLFLDFLKDLSRDYKRYRVNGCADPIRVLSIACRQSRQRGEQFLRKDDGDVIETLAELGLINLIEGNRYQLPLEELMDMLCAIDAISVLLTDDLLPVDLKEEVPTAAVRRAAIPCGAERTVSFCLALLSGSPLQEPYASRLSCSYALDRHAPRHDCRAIRLMLDDPSFTCSFVNIWSCKNPQRLSHNATMGRSIPPREKFRHNLSKPYRRACATSLCVQKIFGRTFLLWVLRTTFGYEPLHAHFSSSCAAQEC